MSHLHQDQLLLLAYGELAETDAAAAEQHLAACPDCRIRLGELERARVAYDLVQARPARRSVTWFAAALAAAAVLAALLLPRGAPTPIERVWPPSAGWSPHAGYMAGGTNVLQIDAQLTRLEQESHYALPD